jgi:hypothetical protein
VQAEDPETAVGRIIELLKTRIPWRFGLDPITPRYAATHCVECAEALAFVILHFVTLVRPSTLTGISPLMVERRTTRFWSPVIDGAMLGGGIVARRHIAGVPAPADGIFELGNMGLQHFEQMVRIRLRISNEAADEIPKYQGALTGAGEDTNHRVFGFVNRRGEHLHEKSRSCAVDCRKTKSAVARIRKRL